MAQLESGMSLDALPTEYSVDLCIKIGQPYSNSRTSYGAIIPLKLVTAEGYSIFREKIRRQVAVMEEITWGDESPIMLKPTSNAAQAKYEALLASDIAFHQQLTRIWRLASRRKCGQGAFKLEVYIYVTKVTTQSGIRRATETRIATASTAINDHLARTGESSNFGPASLGYWAISQARQPENAPIVTPSTTTFAQLQSIDSQQREIDSAVASVAQTTAFVSIRCKINGGMVPLELDLTHRTPTLIPSMTG